MQKVKEIIQKQQAQSITPEQTSTAIAKAQISSSNETCSKCHDTGWILAGDGASQCECIAEQCVAKAFEDAPRYAHARLSDFDRKIVDAVLAALAKTKEGLFIVGPVGSGKTHLAAAILRSRYEIGKSAKFVRAANLYRAIRESYQVGYIGLTEEQILNTYGTSEFLIIDDLAAGSLSDHERRIALEVIDIRMNRLLQTVVTSNLLVEDIRKQMDERIASRLQSFIKIALTTTVDWRVRAKM